jgi:hypothetical protein
MRALRKADLASPLLPLVLLVLVLAIVRPSVDAQGAATNARLFTNNPTTGNWDPVQSGAAGGIPVGGYSATNITTATTTTLKTGAGQVHCVAVNTGGTGSTATLYNNTAGSGAKIGTVTTTAAGTTPCYDVVFTIGLTVVTTGSPAADLTVGWR